MLTFQPRWVFDDVTGENAPNAEKIKLEIRKKLKQFDTVEVSPFLGAYGQENNREWMQYFLDDENGAEEKCPFNHSSKVNSSVVISKTYDCNLKAVIKELLPPTGSIEVQYDSSHREHDWHSHKLDESLHIIEGSMELFLKSRDVICNPGDRILLPANTLHRSVAGAAGCLYIIATRIAHFQELKVTSNAK